MSNAYRNPQTLGNPRYSQAVPQQQPMANQAVLQQQPMVEQPVPQQQPMVEQPPPSGGGEFGGGSVQERTNAGLIGSVVVAAIIAIIALGIAIAAMTGHISSDSIGASELKDTDDYTLGNLTVTNDTHLGTLSSDTTKIIGDIDLGSGLFESNLIPKTDDTYDIGSATKAWQDLYLAGSLSTAAVGSSLIPDTDQKYDLGSATKRFDNIWGVSVHGATFTMDMLPDHDNEDDIGSPTLRYKSLYLGSGGLSVRGGGICCTGDGVIEGSLSVNAGLSVNGPVTIDSNGVSIITSGPVVDLLITGKGGTPREMLITHMDQVQIDTSNIFRANGTSIQLVGPTTYYRQEMVAPGDCFSAGIQYLTGGETISLPRPQPNYLYEFTFIATADAVTASLDAGTSGASVLGSFVNHSGNVSYNSNPGASPNIRLLAGSSAGDKLTLVSQSTNKYFILNALGDWEFF